MGPPASILPFLFHNRTAAYHIATAGSNIPHRRSPALRRGPKRVEGVRPLVSQNPGSKGLASYTIAFLVLQTLA